jgi:hypothetical protein
MPLSGSETVLARSVAIRCLEMYIVAASGLFVKTGC